MFTRYVAIGDSSTEGLDDPDGRGGFRGWANRLAERLAAAQGSVGYANLGIRGRRTRQIMDQQLGPALAMEPDLVTVFSGTNDVVARRFDADQVAQDMEEMQRSLIRNGATVLTFTLPDLTPVMPLARFIRGRVHRLNEALWHAASESGAILVDVARHPVASDSRLWSRDRLHANAEGHFRIAAALAQAIGLGNDKEDWWRPFPDPLRQTPVTWLWDELRWGREHLLPWIGRHLAGRSSGDGRVAKRPQLLPLLSADSAGGRSAQFDAG